MKKVTVLKIVSTIILFVSASFVSIGQTSKDEHIDKNVIKFIGNTTMYLSYSVEDAESVKEQSEVATIFVFGDVVVDDVKTKKMRASKLKNTFNLLKIVDVLPGEHSIIANLEGDKRVTINNFKFEAGHIYHVTYSGGKVALMKGVGLVTGGPMKAAATMEAAVTMEYDKEAYKNELDKRRKSSTFVFLD